MKNCPGIIRSWFLTLVLGISIVSAVGANTGVDVLKIPLVPQAIALGDAYIGLAKGVSAFSYNPAGLARIDNLELSFAHHMGLIDSVEYLAVAGPLKAGGIMGASVLYRYMPDIDNPGAIDGPVNSNDMVVAVGYALDMEVWGGSTDLTAGVSLKWIRSVLGNVTASTAAVNLGVWWQPETLKALQLGLAVQNIGSPLKYLEEEEILPFNTKLGAAYKLLHQAPHQIRVAADFNVPLETQWWSASVGAEYWLHQLVALRIGYLYQNESLASVLRGGAGVSFPLGQLNLQMDYAF